MTTSAIRLCSQVLLEESPNSLPFPLEGNPMIAQVKEVIETKVRPVLNADGGDIELVDVEDGIVKVKLVGACAHCPSSALTLYEGVEKMLMELIPEVKGIEQIW